MPALFCSYRQPARGGWVRFVEIHERVVIFPANRFVNQAPIGVPHGIDSWNTDNGAGALYPDVATPGNQSNSSPRNVFPR
jgi:hypothetical protein